MQGTRCIELAVEEARTLGDHYLGTEHLLLGMLRDEGEANLASQVLRAAGVSLDTAREAVTHALAKKQAKAAAASAPTAAAPAES